MCFFITETAFFVHFHSPSLGPSIARMSFMFTKLSLSFFPIILTFSFLFLPVYPPPPSPPPRPPVSLLLSTDPMWRGINLSYNSSKRHSYIYLATLPSCLFTVQRACVCVHVHWPPFPFAYWVSFHFPSPRTLPIVAERITAGWLFPV